MPATGAWGHGGCMMKFRENEDAVSPVIGVILMVAITVILAAVIAAFVFGMTGNIQGTKVVSIGSKLDGDNIVLTINGGPDLSTLQELRITLGGENVTDVAYNNVSVTVSYPPLRKNFKVGDTITIKDNNKGRLLVVGKWSDGAEQIIIDHTY